jgi:hypothetical protein
LRGIEEFLTQRLNVPLVNNDDERALLSIVIELRNIYTHSRGVVNELFLSRIAGHEHPYKFSQGKRFHAEFDEIVGFANNLFDIGIRLDGRALAKFGLQKKRYVTWDAPRIAQLRKDAGKRDVGGNGR